MYTAINEDYFQINFHFLSFDQSHLFIHSLTIFKQSFWLNSETLFYQKKRRIKMTYQSKRNEAYFFYHYQIN